MNAQKVRPNLSREAALWLAQRGLIEFITAETLCRIYTSHVVQILTYPCVLFFTE